MSKQQPSGTQIHVSAEKIGGIDETTIDVEPGVSVLTGRNATNRTSFLRAMMAALGSDEVALKSDADEGTVELHLGNDRYYRTLSRRQGSVVLEGEPFLEDAQLADLFAFLLESNDARRAVERGEDLRDVIMRPVDTAEIEAEIRRLEERRQAVARELEELEALESTLPDLEAERTTLETEIEETCDVYDAKRAELETLRETRGGPAELKEPLEALREARADLDSVRRSLTEEEDIIEALRDDQDELQRELEGLGAVDEDELPELEATIGDYRDRVESIEATLSEIQSVIQLNESFLDENLSEIELAIRDESGAGSDGNPTDQLVDEQDEMVCWTCGHRVNRDHIVENIDRLRAVHTDKIDQRNSLRAKIEELERERKHIKRTIEQRRRLEEQLSEVESDLDDRIDRVEQLETEASELQSDIDELEAAVDDLHTDDEDEYLTLHREINELEVELDRLESDLDEVEEEIESIEQRLAEREDLEAEHDDIDDEIETLRYRIEQLESDVVEHFNTQMDELLERLEFENIERVWIEQFHPDDSARSRMDTGTKFDLHIVRSNPSGAMYEDTIDHLSESEREVVGLVFALSGYLVHEVYEDVPFMLLDSLEALDSERIATLIDYLAEYAPNVVVALLPEDAQAVNEEYERVTEI